MATKIGFEIEIKGLKQNIESVADLNEAIETLNQSSIELEETEAELTKQQKKLDAAFEAGAISADDYAESQKQIEKQQPKQLLKHLRNILNRR